jgi:coproporphyrinogen III oxidase
MWQEIRRGRYVEFNLVHDSELIWLKTNGRIESIYRVLHRMCNGYTIIIRKGQEVREINQNIRKLANGFDLIIFTKQTRKREMKHQYFQEYCFELRKLVCH